MLRLLFALPLLASCVFTTDAPAQVVLGSSSTGSPDESTGSTAAPVMTSTEAGSTSSGETTGDESASSSGDASSAPSTSTGEGTTSTTGEALPDCRNDDPTATCRVFVSSGEAAANLGVENFHTLCTDLACNASPTCGEYHAVIRVSGAFWEPFYGFTGSYVLTSGAVVASGFNSLPLAASINEDETGMIVAGKSIVWTGYSGLDAACAVGDSLWSTTSPDVLADVGYAGGEGLTKWDAEQVGCDTLARVYCVEVPQ